MGKTRLALATAEATAGRFADGVYFVPLAPVTEAPVMWTTMAEVLGITGDGRSPPTFFEHIADLRALLLLDNLEQLPDAAQVVAELMGVVGAEIAAVLPGVAPDRTAALARSLVATVHGHCAFALYNTFRFLGETQPEAAALALADRRRSPVCR